MSLQRGQPLNKKLFTFVNTSEKETYRAGATRVRETPISSDRPFSRALIGYAGDSDLRPAFNPAEGSCFFSSDFFS